MTPTWKHILIAATLAFCSSTILEIFVSPFESTVAGFAVGILYLLSLQGKMPKIDVIKHVCTS